MCLPIHSSALAQHLTFVRYLFSYIDDCLKVDDLQSKRYGDKSCSLDAASILFLIQLGTDIPGNFVFETHVDNNCYCDSVQRVYYNKILQAG